MTQDSRQRFLLAGAAAVFILWPAQMAQAKDCSSYFGEMGPGAASCPCGDSDACARAATNAWNGQRCRTSSFLGEMNDALWETGTSFFSSGSCAAVALTMSACGNALCEPTEPFTDVDDTHHDGTGTGDADAGTADGELPADPGGDGGGGNWNPLDGIVAASGALTIPGVTQFLADWVITPLFGEDYLLGSTDTQLFLGTVVVAGSIVVGFVASAYAEAAAATYLGTGYLGSAAAGAIPGLVDYLVTQSLLHWASDGRAGEITTEGAVTALLLGGALGAFGKYLKGRLTGLGGAANQTDNFADDAYRTGDEIWPNYLRPVGTENPSGVPPSKNQLISFLEDNHYPQSGTPVRDLVWDMRTVDVSATPPRGPVMDLSNTTPNMDVSQLVDGLVEMERRIDLEAMQQNFMQNKFDDMIERLLDNWENPDGFLPPPDDWAPF